LQRTGAETVGEFIQDFCSIYPTRRSLALASIEELEERIKPIGLWRRRSKVVYALSNEMAKRGGRFPSVRSELESLPGVGQYVASAILLFCHGKQEPLLDVNMARVLERYFGPRRLADIRYDNHLQSLSRDVISGNRAIEMNWAILDFAAAICNSRSPKCQICPISAMCKWEESITRDIC